MEEEDNSDSGSSDKESFGELCPDNEGLEDRLLASPLPHSVPDKHTGGEFNNEEKDFHDTEQIDGNFHAEKEAFTNTVDNNGVIPVDTDTLIDRMEVEKAKFPPLSIASTSGDHSDDQNFASFTPTKELSTSKSFGSTSGHLSPRPKRYGLGILSGKKQSNLSSLDEESAALNELYLILSGKNSDKLLVERDAAGFISSLHIINADIDGPIPECICMFTQLSVLVLRSCKAIGPFPFWIDALAGLEKLDLSDNRLTGPISESVSSLRLLQELTLHSNQLSGTIPDGIGYLKALSTLQLHHNELTGSIPDSICRLPKLSICDLSSCLLSGHIPYRIGKLKHLSVLNLESNNLTGTIPGSLWNLPALKVLNLAHNSLRGRLPDNLGQLHLLFNLNLSHNELTGSLPASIGGLTSLTALSLANNHFRGPIPESICGLSMLESLALNKNLFSGGIPVGLGRLQGLKTLCLSYNRLKGSIPKEVCSLSQLTELSMDRNSLTGCFPEDIGLLDSLVTLDVSHNQLSGDIPEGVGALKNLDTLHLSHNRLAGGIPESIGSLVCLQILNISHNQLSGPLPESIVELRALRDLDVSVNRLAGTIPVGIVDLPHLTEVNFIDTFLSGYDIQKGAFLMSPCGIWATDQYGQRSISVVNFEDWSPIFYHEAPLVQKEHRKYPIPMSLISLFPHALFLFPPKLLGKVSMDASFYSHVRPAVLAFLKKLCEAQNPCILKCLVVLWYLLTAASKVHISEEADLLEFAEEVVGITNELFKCPSMDKLKNVQRLVLEPQYCQPIQRNLDDSFHSVTYWNMAHIFSDNSPIQFCLEHNHKVVLALTQITSITGQLFWGCINTVPNGGEEEPMTPWEFSNTEFHSFAAYKVFACPRYTPAVMFFTEGMSKLLTLLIVSFVCFNTYGMHNHGEYAGSFAENALVVMMFGQILYEFGQLASCNWSLREYFSGVWNILDVTCCVLLLVWALLLPFPHLFAIGKVAIALAAIPLAFVQLQYLSLIKTLGLLVLMIQSMITDVYTFIVVYLVCIYGFTVCFRAMFYTINDFSSTGITFVTLFQSTLGNFRFDEFDGTFKLVGVLVMVLFLTLTNVLLVNLLIAQMSSTYNRIIFKSREEWTFIKATYVQDNMLLRESSPFCMLPAPLNLVTVALYPLHTWALEHHHVSVAGTVADYMLGMWLFLPRTLLYWWKCVVAAFLDAEEEDVEFQEAYHLAIRALIYCLGKRPSRIVAYLLSLPVGAIYVAVSSALRVFHAVVRVKPQEVGESEDGYEINFYLDSGEGDFEQEPAKLDKKVTEIVSKTAASNSGLPGLRAVKSAFRLLGPSDKSVLGRFKDPSNGAYTFCDYMPDICESVRTDGSEGEDWKKAPVVSSRVSQRVAPAASPTHPPPVTQKSLMLHLQIESDSDEIPGVTVDDLVDKGCRSPASPQQDSHFSGKMKPKTSFLGLDGFLNFGQISGRKSPLTSDRAQGDAIPAEAGQSNGTCTISTGAPARNSQEETAHALPKGILATAFPSKQKHKVDIRELGSHTELAFNPPVDNLASDASHNSSSMHTEQLGQVECSLPAFKENTRKSSFFLQQRLPSKKPDPHENALLDSAAAQGEERSAHSRTARRRSGGGRPQNRRLRTRRQSKQLSGAFSYHSDEDEHDQAGDSEERCDDRDGHDSEVDSDDQHDAEWERRSDDESMGQRGHSSASIDALKSKILFTPDDIERMFPAAENRKTQQEREEQLFRLRASSDQAMTDATANLVANFDTKLQDVVSEMKTLRSAVLNDRVEAPAMPAAVAEPMSVVPTPSSSAAHTSAEVEQLQAELLGLQKDMKDIKKLLGNILIKLK